MKTKTKEISRQLQIWISSISVHVFMITSMYLLFIDKPVSNVTLLFGSFVIGMMGKDGYTLFTTTPEGSDGGERLSTHFKELSRQYQIWFNGLMVIFSMAVILLLVFNGKDVSSLGEMYAAYIVGVLGKEGWGLFSKPSS